MLLALLLPLAWAALGSRDAQAQSQTKPLADAGHMPTLDEMASAAAALQPQAAALGLHLAVAPTDWAGLRLRAPLLVARLGQQCRISYSAYIPGTDFAWLFPPLAPAERRVWLEALVAHELAHCAIDQRAEQVEPGAPAQAPGQTVGVAAPVVLARQIGPAPHTSLAANAADEALADLAFARHARQRLGERGRSLVAQLAALRSAARRHDPVHDTSAVLRCDLAQADTPAPDNAAAAAADWLRALRARQARCQPGEPASRTAGA